MTVEDIFRGRQNFADKVKQSVQNEFSQMGLTLISFSLKEISDNQGYLDALGKPHIAAAKRDAAIAEAETEKEAVIKSSEARKEGEVARLTAEAQIAKTQWENEAKKASSQVEVNQRKAQADYAYELERYRLSQDIKREDGKVKFIEKQEAIKMMGTDTATDWLFVGVAYGGKKKWIINNPYRSEILQGKDGTLEVIYYYTDVKSADDAITDDELTPLIFKNDILLGWGQSFLNDSIQRYEIRVR